MGNRLAPILGGSVVLLGSLALVAAGAGLLPLPSVDAGPRHAIAAIRTCATSPIAPGVLRPAARGAWWKTEDALDASGRLVGARLFVGRDAATTGVVDLPPESSASGPIDGIVVVAADDGTRSRVSLIDVALACESAAYETTSVVRTAILDAARGRVLVYLLERTARADLGTWSVSASPADTGDPLLVAPPLGADGVAIGPVWSTELRLDATGRRLVVQSCGQARCLSRIADLERGDAPISMVAGADQGALLGLAGDRLVTWAACPGLPCSVVAWEAGRDGAVELVGSASAASLTGDGRRLVILRPDFAGGGILEVDPATGAVRALPPLPAGQRPFGAGGGARAGLEVAPDEVAVGDPAGRPSPFRPDAAAEVAP
jgi:hypothetical protein